MSGVAVRDEWLIPTLEKLLEASQVEVVRNASDAYWATAVSQEFTTDEALLTALGARYRMPMADLAGSTVAARDAVSEALARKHHIVPLTVSDSTIEIAVANPNDFDCERELGFATGKSVRMLLASPSAIATTLDALYRPEEAIESILEGAAGGAMIDVVEESDDAGGFDLGADKASARPIIKLVDHIISEGISLRASDIHLEAQESGVQVTYRVDGVLRPAMKIPRAAGIPLVSRIKIMSGLDIADRLRPQDGRARVSLEGKRVDLRVSTLPASTGEKVVIRILDSTNTILQLDALGIREADLARVHQLINLREGIILVTGPTGSGKTTTLYSALKTIQARGVNIVTVEDPVEYKLNGIVQVQVNEKAGLTFAAALRSILRQDPDVVLVGEVRDRETAGIAIQASLTGHLVLSTLHTIDAASSIARLLDIGIESYKIAAALKGVVAQRLVRRLCPACKEPAVESPSPRMRRWIPDGALTFKPQGCSECGNTGYHGRLALMEVLVSTAEVERRISGAESAERIADAAREGGMQGLWMSGVDHVLEGNTDIEELLRVVEVPVPREPARVEPPRRSPTPRGSPSQSSRPRTGVQETQADPWSQRTGASPLAGDAFELSDDIAALVNVPRLPRALIVEDDDAARLMLREALEAAGFAVTESVDGIGALEEIDHAQPDVVLLDLNIPGMDGFDVLSRLRTRRQTSQLPVVVLTSSSDEDHEIRVFESGATDFVAKPFRARALSARLKALVRAK